MGEGVEECSEEEMLFEVLWLEEGKVDWLLAGILLESIGKLDTVLEAEAEVLSEDELGSLLPQAESAIKPSARSPRCRLKVLLLELTPIIVLFVKSITKGLLAVLGKGKYFGDVLG